MSNFRLFACNLAAAFLAGTWSPSGMLSRGARACGSRERWLRPLIRRVCAAFHDPPVDRDGKRLAYFIARDRGFQSAYRSRDWQEFPLLHQVFWITPVMSPTRWQVPALTTSSALEDWLGLTPGELTWFADIHGHEAEAKPGPLRHYTYQWLRKSTHQWRLLEQPKSRLKAIQRRILHEILDQIPPHDAVHGYRRGRSIATFAAPHCGRRFVLRFDLRHFFPSVRRSRIHALFAAAGYPREVAGLLAALCANLVPEDVWQAYPGHEYAPLSWQDQQRYRAFHPPQGAPTSPALANLCAYRLDCRLHALAQSIGATYTRYADDLAFSGDRELERMAKRFQVLVCRIVLEEGFELNLRKSRFMRQGVRQQLVGIVVNAHCNFRRDEFDRLKAILHNCVRYGPASQNRLQHADFRSHLLGKIAHVTLLNVRRGEKLRAMFNRIDWDNSTTVS